MHKHLLLALALVPLMPLHGELEEIENQLGTHAAALAEQRSNLQVLSATLKEDAAVHKKIERELKIDKEALKEIEEHQANLGALEKAFINATMKQTKHVGDRAIRNQKELFKHLDDLLEKQTFENVAKSVPKIDEALSTLQDAAAALSTARQGDL